MNNLFLENGYVDMARIIEQKYPFILMTGARGTGKTYGALKYVIEHKMKFIYMRRTKLQADVISSPEMSPFAPVCDDMSVSLEMDKISKEALHPFPVPD